MPTESAKKSVRRVDVTASFLLSLMNDVRRTAAIAIEINNFNQDFHKIFLSHELWVTFTVRKKR